MNAFKNVLLKLDIDQQEKFLNTRNGNKQYNLYPVHETSATKECTLDKPPRIRQVHVKFGSRSSSL